MNRKYDNLELIDIRRMTARGVNVNIAVARQAYSPDRLVAWRGRFNAPAQVWNQQSTETRSEFYDRIRREARKTTNR